MAGRVNASGEIFRRTTNLPALNSFTLAGIGYRYANRADEYQYFAGLENATSDSTGWLLLGWNLENFLHLSNDYNSGEPYLFPSGPANATWFDWFIRSNGVGSYQVGWKAHDGGSWAVGTLPGTLSWTPVALHLGNDSWDEWCDIALERVRVWDAALTNAELDAELASATPVITAGLRANWPLVSDANDTTANAYHLTAVGAISWESGPFGAAGVSGAGGAVIGGLTGAGVASVGVNGTGGAVLGALAGAGAGTVGSTAIAGAGGATVGALAGAGAAVVGVNGAGAALIGGLTGAGTAQAAIGGAGGATVGAITGAGRAYRLVGASAGGVLQVDPVNGRYFRTASAGTIVLAGFHTWASLSDSWPTLPIQPFDFDAYLADLVGRGCNFLKLWSFETARYWGDSDQYFGPLPWARTGPGNAADGRPKFDLAQFDPEYFTRLHERAIKAGNAGVYVCVQLFQGWHISSKGLAYNPWPHHPMHPSNNINGVDGDTNANGTGEETRNDSITAVTTIQRAYVLKVLQTLADLDNVFYEIANEEDPASFAWQTGLMDYIRATESGWSKQHLVGLTVTWPTGNNAAMLASSADWISTADDLTPDDAPGTKPSGGDTDHWGGIVNDRLWVWRTFLRGHNPWYMDEYAGETYGNDTRNSGLHVALRNNLGHVLDYSRRLDLQNASPAGSRSSTGYCLAKLAGAAQLLAYQDGSGAFTLDLAGLAGTFAVEWLRTLNGDVQAGGTVQGGATRTLTPPWSGEDAVAFLEVWGVEGAGGAVIGLLAAAGAGSVAVAGAGAATIGAVTGAGAAVVAVQAVGAAVIGAITGAGAAAVAISGAGGATVGAITGAGVASVGVNGAGGATVGRLTGAGAGTVGSDPGVAGSGGATVGAITGAGVGVVEISGQGGATVGALTGAGAAQAEIAGVGAATLGMITGAGAAVVGSQPITAVGGAVLGLLSSAGVGSVAVAGQGAAVIGALVGQGVGSVAITAVGGATIGELVASPPPVVVIVTVLGWVLGPGSSGSVSGPRAKATIGG